MQFLENREDGGDDGDKRKVMQRFYCCYSSCVTCAASLQSCSVGRHHPRVSSLARLSDPDLKWTTRDVTSIELHIDEIEAVLSGDEPDCVLIYTNREEVETC